MKINEHTRLTGNKVILVPYEKHHVPKYSDFRHLFQVFHRFFLFSNIN